MHTQPIFNLATLTNNIMSNNNRIQAMLTNLKLQDVSNYSKIAKKHGVVCTTLMKWFTVKSILHFEADTKY